MRPNSRTQQDKFQQEQARGHSGEVFRSQEPPPPTRSKRQLPDGLMATADSEPLTARVMAYELRRLHWPNHVINRHVPFRRRASRSSEPEAVRKALHRSEEALGLPSGADEGARSAIKNAEAACERAGHRFERARAALGIGLDPWVDDITKRTIAEDKKRAKLELRAIQAELDFFEAIAAFLDAGGTGGLIGHYAPPRYDGHQPGHPVTHERVARRIDQLGSALVHRQVSTCPDIDDERKWRLRADVERATVREWLIAHRGEVVDVHGRGRSRPVVNLALVDGKLDDDDSKLPRLHEGNKDTDRPAAGRRRINTRNPESVRYTSPFKPYPDVESAQDELLDKALQLETDFRAVERGAASSTSDALPSIANVKLIFGLRQEGFNARHGFECVPVLDRPRFSGRSRGTTADAVVFGGS